MNQRMINKVFVRGDSKASTLSMGQYIVTLASEIKDNPNQYSMLKILTLFYSYLSKEYNNDLNKEEIGYKWTGEDIGNNALVSTDFEEYVIKNKNIVFIPQDSSQQIINTQLKEIFDRTNQDNVFQSASLATILIFTSQPFKKFNAKIAILFGILMIYIHKNHLIDIDKLFEQEELLVQYLVFSCVLFLPDEINPKYIFENLESNIDRFTNNELVIDMKKDYSTLSCRKKFAENIVDQVESYININSIYYGVTLKEIDKFVTLLSNVYRSVL
jgi:hypothetical protein